MKNFVRRPFVLLAFLSPIVVAGSARAAVVWTATFESNKSGDVCSSGAATAEFKPGINEKNGTRINAQVLATAAHSGNLGCQITVHPDDLYDPNQDRVDIQHPSTLTKEGSDLYLSGHYMMPDDAKVRNEIGFFETVKPTYQNWLDFWVAPKTGGGTTLTLGIEFLGAIPIWTGDFAKGVWHQIAIHVHWSANAQMGQVDFWLDGKQVVTAYKHKTKPNTDDFFFQTGLHRKDPSNNVDVINFDDFIEATTQDEIKIAAPGSTPDGGAPTDASGGAGTSGSGGGAGTSGAGGTGSAGGAGATGAAGAAGSGGTTGAAGSGGTTGAAGSAGTTGGAGTAGTGGTSGAAGTGGAHASKSGGCSIAGDQSGSALVLIGLALLGLGARRRRS